MKICLIEDNSNDVELTKIALRKAGMAVELLVFRDGAEALDSLLTGDPMLLSGLRIIFLDLKLPRINGFEVMQKLRSSALFDAVPIVILSSSAVESDIQRAYSLGANSYIVKPIDYLQHARAVTETVRYWTEINTLP